MSKIKNKVKNFFTFFKDVGKEMRKVSWLKRKEVMSKTWIVLVFSFILLVFLGLSDYLISQLMDLVFDK